MCVCGCATKHDLVGLVVGGGRDESLHEQQEHCIIWWTDLDAVFGNGRELGSLEDTSGSGALDLEMFTQ